MSRMLRGAIDGMIAGIPMAMFAMGAAMLRERSFTRPMKLMAGTIEGRNAARGGTTTDLIGMAIHLSMSMLFGGLFATILRLTNFRRLLPASVLGVLYALGLWAFNESVTLPVVDPLMARRMPRGLFAISHVFYGLALGFLLGHFRPSVFADQDRPLNERLELEDVAQ